MAEGTREGELYLRLLDKLEEQRQALGGKVFDVLSAMNCPTVGPSGGADDYVAGNPVPRPGAQRGGRAAGRPLELAETYQWLLVPRQPVPTGPIEWDALKADGEGGLAERACRKLVNGGGLYTSYPPVLLRLQLDGPLAPLWEGGRVTVTEVWKAYA